MAEQMMQEAAGKAIPAGYKQTEVGIIPEDWTVANLSAITEHSRPISYGIVQTGPLIVNGVPCIRVVDISDGKIKRDNLITTTKEISDSYRRTILKDGDLIIPLRGKVGEVGLVDGDLVGANLTRGVALIAPQKDYASEFIKQYLSNRSSADRLLSSMNGSALQEITIETLRRFSIALPIDVKEQTAIGNVLSDSDALIDALEQLIAKKQAIKTAAMQQLLTGRTRLPQFALRSDGTPKGYKTSELGQIPEDWEIMPLVSIGRTIRGVSYNPNNDLYISDSSDSIRLFRSNNILNSRLVFSGLQYVSKNRVSESQKMQLGDILICMANGSKSLVGKSAIHDLNDGYEYTFGAFMGVFRLNDASQSKYVYYLMNSARYRCYIDLILAGSSINNLKPSDIDKLSLAFPDIEEQTAIAATCTEP
ncbi:restriction endonuclease subunit S [Aeromonas hydrophila]|uniref:restriction endonuclease subunit S n=1 Tax=Aeromonas hydrophila TaxID=644 RepID=UPI0035A3D617